MAQGAPTRSAGGTPTRSGDKEWPRNAQGRARTQIPPKPCPALSATLPFFIFFLPAGNPSLPRDLAVSFSSSPRLSRFFFFLPAGNPDLPRDFAAFFPFFPAGNPNLPHDLAVFFPSSPRETPTFPVTWPFSSLL